MPSLRLPVLAGPYRIAPELFTRGYRQSCGPQRCNADCCRNGGAYVDLSERDRILAHAELIQPHLDDSQNPDPAQWFEPGEKVDADFPSGACAGTAQVEGACTFLDRRGYCSLQVAALANGLHKWAWKPTYCALFPLDLANGVIKLDGRARHDKCCELATDYSVSAFDACREELSLLIGADAVAEIAAHLNEQAVSVSEPAAVVTDREV